MPVESAIRTLSLVVVLSTLYNLFELCNMAFKSRLYPDVTDSKDRIRTSIVMPCTIGEGMTSLPMALRSISESDRMPDEVIVVFGLGTGVTLENELEKVLPSNINEGIDKARDMLRYLILYNLHIDDPNDEIVVESIKVNGRNNLEFDLKHPGPLDYLNAMGLDEYLKEGLTKNDLGGEDNALPRSHEYLNGIYN